MVTPTNSPTTVPTPSTSQTNPWGIPPTSSEPGLSMPSPREIEQQQGNEKSGLKTCGNTLLTIGRYPVGGLAGLCLVLNIPLVFMIGYPTIAVGGMCCCDSFKAADAMGHGYIKLMGYCFRGFKSSEQCAEDGCCICQQF